MKERVHSRTMTIETYDIGNDRILVEGSLRDERFHAAKPNPGEGIGATKDIIHDMTVGMTLSVPHLKVLSLEADTPVIPHPDCAEIKDSVQKLQGIQIKHGFTEEVQRLLGKTQGCLHLMNLVLAMGSAAVQGMWSLSAGKRRDGQTGVPADNSHMLVDSCWLWRKDGPFAMKLKNRA